MTCRVVVTGATGAVGPAVVNHLAADPGTSVVALARHLPPGTLSSGVRFEACDLFDDRTLTEVRAADVVLHLAARLHVNQPGADLRSEYERINIEATRRLVDATRPDARFVFFSTIDVYGPTLPGALADETSPPNPPSLYGETKLRAESVALEHPGATVLRLAAVYGPRIKANYARLLRALSRGRYVPIGPGANLRTLVFEADVASAARIVAMAGALPSRLYNVTDGAVHPVREIVDAIATALGRRVPGWFVPAPMARSGAVVADGLCRLVGRRSPVTPQMIDKLQEYVAVSGARLMRESSYRPAYDLSTGWRAAVAAL